MTPDVTSGDSDIYKFPYTVYNLTNRYVTDDGYVQLPLARQQVNSTDNTCVVVRMHAGICKRIITIEAMRIGKWPTLPNMAQVLVDENGIVETRLSSEIDNSAPQIEADKASRSFALRGTYTYALSRPPTATERLRSGSIPMDSTDPDGNSIPLSEVTDQAGHIQWEPPVA